MAGISNDEEFVFIEYTIRLNKCIPTRLVPFLFNYKSGEFVDIDDWAQEAKSLFFFPSKFKKIVLRVSQNVAINSDFVSSKDLDLFNYSARILNKLEAWLYLTRWVARYSSRYDCNLDVYGLRNSDHSLDRIYSTYIADHSLAAGDCLLKNIEPKAEEKIQGIDANFLSIYTENLFFKLKKGIKATVSKKIFVCMPSYAQPNLTAISILSIYRDLISTIFYLDIELTVDIYICEDSCPDQKSLMELESYFAGLRLAKLCINPQNLGYLMNCNANTARYCSPLKYNYIYLLNNDTELIQGCIYALLETFYLFESVGISGSRQISQDGKIQEAGGIVWRDGSAWNYGKNFPHDKPQFNFSRNVDYISAASIMITTELWQALEGFNEIFKPAYYEDTDLAMRVRELGYKVVYQSHSKIIHHEGMSYGGDQREDTSSKFHQIKNKDIFLKRWESVLSKNHNPNAKCIDKAIHRGNIGNALIVENLLLTPDKDAGSLYMMNNCLALSELGYHVTYVPSDNFCYMKDIASNMGLRGIEILAHPRLKKSDLYEGIEGNIPIDYERNFELILVARPERNKDIAILKNRYPQAKIMYYTHDLHHERLKVLGDNEPSEKLRASYYKESLEAKKREKNIFSIVDIVLHVSKAEELIAKKLIKHISCVIDPVVVAKNLSNKCVSYHKKSIIFIGSFNHTPNVEGLKWFLSNVWPDVIRKDPKIKFYIIGANLQGKLLDICKSLDNVLYKGYVASLDDIMSKSAIGIAPLISGAGVKGKILTYLAHGLPVVSTSFGAQGIFKDDDNHPFAKINDNAKVFADLIIDLINHEDEQLFELSSQASKFISSRYSPENLIANFKEALSMVDLPYLNKDSFVPYYPTSLDYYYSHSNSCAYYVNN